MGAELPEECFGLLEPSFLSPSFLFWAPLGRYFGWLETRGQEDWRRAYDIYAAGLSRMGHGRWLMKSPVHMWGLSALLERFPDALVVQIHRERGDAVASFRKLVAAHHRIYRAEPDDAEAGDFAETVVHTGSRAPPRRGVTTGRTASSTCPSRPSSPIRCPWCGASGPGLTCPRTRRRSREWPEASRPEARAEFPLPRTGCRL